jgi:TorA maturation chaperone TorD
MKLNEKNAKFAVIGGQYQFENEAADFCNAIKRLAENPDSLENLESYLSTHFQYWLEKFADKPENIAAELAAFAETGV